MRHTFANARTICAAVVVWLGLQMRVLPAWAQPMEDDAPPPIETITEYRLKPDSGPVYGVFDIGDKPSIRLYWPSGQPGHLRFVLYGRHYSLADTRPFVVRARFEDVTGRVFSTSAPLTFNSNQQSDTTPTWFVDLDRISGVYGKQAGDISVPTGTAVIEIMGDLADSRNAGTDALLGYLGQLQLDGLR